MKDSPCDDHSYHDAFAAAFERNDDLFSYQIFGWTLLC